jgi:hypothetical protein
MLKLIGSYPLPNPGNCTLYRPQKKINRARFCTKKEDEEVSIEYLTQEQIEEVRKVKGIVLEIYLKFLHTKD